MMSDLIGIIEIKLESEAILGGDGIQQETVDIDIQSDEYGFPYFTGRTLKGVLRREAKWYVDHLQDPAYKDALNILFGQADKDNIHHANYESLRFGTAKLSDAFYEAVQQEAISDREVLQAMTLIRTMTSIDYERGIAKDGSLRQARVIHSGYTFFAPIFSKRPLNDTEKDLLETSIKLLRHIGMMRSRGKGAVTCQMHWTEASTKTVIPKERSKEKYITLTIDVQEPLKINDILRTSDSTYALNYIPGRVIRGALIQAYLQDRNIPSEQLDTANIFHDENIQFLNGYLCINGQRSVPFAQNLFETKSSAKADNDVKEVSNSLDKKDYDKIRHLSPVRVKKDMMIFAEEKVYGAKVAKTGSLHISLSGPHITDEKSKLYRYEAIAPNQQFQAIIKTQTEHDFIDWLREQDELILWFGGARNSGYGRTKVTVQTSERNPEHEMIDYDDLLDEFYILATSDWILYNDQGQLISALDETWLSEQLGTPVKRVDQIIQPTVTGGYIFPWRAFQPMIRSVSAGSIFRYKVKSGSLNKERLMKLMEEGVGLRRNEGFGRLLILPEWSYKEVEKAKPEETLNLETIKREHVDFSSEQREFMQFAKSIIAHDLEKLINQQVEEWFSSIDKKKASATQWGNLIETTSHIEQLMQQASNKLDVYKNEWLAFWKSYEDRRKSKSKTIFENIKVKDRKLGEHRLKDFILEQLPKKTWTSSYFQEEQQLIDQIEYSVKALKLLLRKVIRSRNEEQQTDQGGRAVANTNS